MISKQELTKIAKQKGYTLDAIEKDYALTWTLKAISTNPILSNSLIFKGGTCLSKFYAENYRLSEDLDFSLSKKNPLTLEEIEKELSKSFKEIEKEGAPELRIKKDETHSNLGFVRFLVSYNGPLGQPAKLKLEISLNEKVIFAPMKMPLKDKTYSDIQEFTINCYHFIELFTEKLRAIIQRGKSRDYYDVWQIWTNKNIKQNLHISKEETRKYLAEKYKINNIDFAPEKIFDNNQLNDTKQYWDKDLKRLVKNLPDFKETINELKKDFFEEAQLSEFVENYSKNSIDFGIENLDNIYRNDKSDFLIEARLGIIFSRALCLIIKELDSLKKLDVINSLKLLYTIYESKPYYSMPTEELLAKINNLQKDRDNDIKNWAIELSKMIENRLNKEKVKQNTESH